MYVTPPSFLQYMSNNPESSNVCHTTQFSPMYVTQARILPCMKVETTLPLQKEARILQFTKDESLASFQWCLLRIAHNYPLLLTNKQIAYLTKPLA